MKVIEKIKEKQKNILTNDPVTICFLGDSVTQGCFECYELRKNVVETEFDYKSAYSTRIREILNILYPKVQINIINSGVSGDNTTNALERIDSQILKYIPDLVVVSFGLNDSCAGLDGINKYKENLKKIFNKFKDNNCEVIFLTQNGMNTNVSPHLENEFLRGLAEGFMSMQNSGVVTAYFNAAKEVVNEMGVKLCDLNYVWNILEKEDVNTTELLANKLNHPIREYHYYIAIKLIEKMFEIN